MDVLACLRNAVRTAGSWAGAVRLGANGNVVFSACPGSEHVGSEERCTGAV